GHKPSSFKPKKLHGGKGNREAKKILKCTHCGRRYHEAKDCRIKKYQLRQIENAQQQVHVSTVKKNSTNAQKATAFSCELDPEFVAAMCRLSSRSNMAYEPTSKVVGTSESVMTKQAATFGTDNPKKNQALQRQ
ncbi:hypothetical protein V1521DRAFT_451024, partial [Lipomyces starkeyi]